MLEVRAKGNQKQGRFFIDSIKLEINSGSESLRLLRLKTLPENRNNELLHHLKIRHKYNTVLEYQAHPAAQAHQRQSKAGRWKHHEGCRQLCCLYKHKGSRFSPKYSTIDQSMLRSGQQPRNYICKLRTQSPSAEKLAESSRNKNQQQLNGLRSRIKSHFRQHSLLPLGISQKLAKSMEQGQGTNKKSYLISTPQRSNCLSYHQILQGHCCQLQSQLRSKQQAKAQPRLLGGKPELQLLKQSEINLIKLRSERKQALKKSHYLETNLSPWRTRRSRFRA